MDDQVVQRLLQEGGRDFCQQEPSTSAAIDYMKELLERINSLQEEMHLGSNELSLMSIFKDSKPNEVLFDVERRKEDTRIEICCGGKAGLLVSTVTTLEALGFEIQQCVISCFNDFSLQASCSESFDHGYYLLVKSIQELRSKKDGVVTIGIGGPIGSGKSSLSEKVASVIGCTVMSMDNYRTRVDDGRDLDSIDFDLLVQNLENLINGRDTSTPLFDFQERRRIGSNVIKCISSGVVSGDIKKSGELGKMFDIPVDGSKSRKS